MALTPTYSWPLPDNTDLVKDGAEAIRDLGNAIDTTVSGLGSGLVHIETSDSGGAVSSLSIDDVFSADYRNYKIFINVIGSGEEGLLMRLRTGGVDNSTANSYVFQTLQVSDATFFGVRTTSNIANIVQYQTTLNTGCELTLYNPFLAEETAGRSVNASSVFGAFFRDFVFSHNQSVSYDGFSLFSTSGTFTIQKISVYGLSEG